MAGRMGKSLSTGNLMRRVYTDSQTRKGRYERWENVEGIFDLSRPEEFEDKHILLVDDVVTTGSTLEACANAILSATRNTKVSIATLGFA
jgi:predicted amidophosphoribosyltransferase